MVSAFASHNQSEWLLCMFRSKKVNGSAMLLRFLNSANSLDWEMLTSTLIEVREFRRIRIERMALPKQVLVAASFSFWDFASGH
jgi:hypothetical protein